MTLLIICIYFVIFLKDEPPYLDVKDFICMNWTYLHTYLTYILPRAVPDYLFSWIFETIFIIDLCFGSTINGIWCSWVCALCFYQNLADYFKQLLVQEFPFVRYRAAKGIDGTAITTYRDLLCTKLAAAVWNNITIYKSSISDFPQTETCELLIVDRSIDQVLHVLSDNVVNLIHQLIIYIFIEIELMLSFML